MPVRMAAFATPIYAWTTAGAKPTPQLRMSPAANAACDDFFTRKHRSFTNGRLPRADDEVKALMGYFSVKTSQIANRLRNWKVANSIPGSVLNLGSQYRAGVEADLEERIGDGEDYVVELFEVLRLDPALEEDPDVGFACVAAEASDEVVAFLCGIIVAWCALVLELSAEGINSTGALELQLTARRRTNRQANAGLFADLMTSLVDLEISKLRLIFWLLERRLWDRFTTALRADEHPKLVVPLAQPLKKEDEVWLGPLLAYLAGWLLRRVDLAIKSAATPPSKPFWLAFVLEHSTTIGAENAVGVPLSLIQSRSRGGLRIPSFKLYTFVVHVEMACMSLLSEQMLFLHGNTHVQKVLEAILESAHIRESFVKTTSDARAMSFGSTEDHTTVLLKHIIETWFRMRGPDFVSKIRKRLAIGISQQGKSLGLRSSLAAAASRGGDTQSSLAAEAAVDDPQEDDGEEEEEEKAFPPRHFDDLDDFLQGPEMVSLMELQEAEWGVPFDCESEAYDDDSRLEAREADAQVDTDLANAAACAMSASS